MELVHKDVQITIISISGNMNLLKQSGKHIFKNPYGTFQDENNNVLKFKKKVGGFKNSLDLEEEKKLINLKNKNYPNDVHREKRWGGERIGDP